MMTKISDLIFRLEILFGDNKTDVFLQHNPNDTMLIEMRRGEDSVSVLIDCAIARAAHNDYIYWECMEPAKALKDRSQSSK